MMAQRPETPNVGDTVLVGGNEFEIRAIILEEGSLILVKREGEVPAPEIWVLRQAKFVRLGENIWEAGQYSAFEKADGENERE